MYKPKGLLKVISIIMIIFGVLGAAIMLLSYFILPQMITELDSMGMDSSTLEQALTPLSVAISEVIYLFYILAGVFGVSGKSMRLTVIFGGIYSLITVFNIITSILSTGFSFWYLFNILILVLYWWGIYQSKEA